MQEQIAQLQAKIALLEAAASRKAEQKHASRQGHVVDPKLMEPYQYYLGVPGKNVRGKLIAAFNRWLQVPNKYVEQITEIVRMLHTGSLLVDDIEDNSQLRRGQPCSHLIFGLPSTLNTANYVYVLALEKCMKMGSPSATESFVQELLNLHRGQGQDILWRDSCSCPTEDEYRRMVLDKTGGLFRLAVSLLQAFSEDQRNYRPLLDALAYYFQVRDDYMNLASTDYHANKSFCEDLTEGKFSFPIIHAILSTPGDHRLLNILRQRTSNIEVKRHAVNWMKSCGSLAYTRNKLRDLKAECLNIMQDLGGHDQLEELIEYLDAQVDNAVCAPNSNDEHANSAPLASSHFWGRNMRSNTGLDTPGLSQYDSL